MERVPVQSSNISSAGYDEGQRLMQVGFKRRDGGETVYDYSGVPPEVWHAFLHSPSKGQYLGGHIKGVYPATKVQ